MMSAMVRDGRIASNGGHQLQSEHTGEGKEWTWFLHALWLHMQKLPAEVFDKVHPLNVLYTFLPAILS